MNRRNGFLVLLGAALGGVLGYLVFGGLARRGLYGLAFPGGLLGLGAGIFKTRSKAIPVVCGLAALVLSLFAEWRYEPFVADASLGYFLSHVHQLQPITLVMIAAGTLIGFWVPFRRSQEARRAQQSDENPQAERTER
jgi:F0F1-type ATP synthase assembly protein I